MSSKLTIVFLLLFTCGQLSEAGILGVIGGYGLCQTACNAVWVTCCTSAGVTAGVGTGGVAVPAAVIACNGLQGVCMVSCAASFLAVPTP